MVKFFSAVALLVLGSLQVLAATPLQKQPDKLERPKLVVGIVIDQMRWDFLYRFYDRYGKDGFKRLLREGFSCENNVINYLPSATAVGHAAAFSGSVPAINGITGNSWVDQLSGKTVYCVEDNSVTPVGANNATDGKMSPRNLLTTTITDELRLATNKVAKVVGISLKDRAAILPVGHMANAAFWFDDPSGNFISSTYYMPVLPNWVQEFNKQQHAATFMSKSWNTLYPLESYTQSDSDNRPYEGKLAGETAGVFPHNMPAIYPQAKGAFRTTPFGNTITLNFATAAINGYELGQDNVTDFLTVNCASTDYVGHTFGPNSVEIEDTYLRLDQDLGKFLKMLDAKVGKGKYLVFLTADHGAAHSVGFLQENKLPVDIFTSRTYKDDLNKKLTQVTGENNLVRSISAYQVHLDLPKIAEKNLDKEKIKTTIIDFFQLMPEVLYAVDLEKANVQSIPEFLREKLINGYNSKRTGSIQIILKSGYFDGPKTGTSHGAWNPYDTHLPLIFMGWKIKPGQTSNRVSMTDIAPTLAALLHIQMPNGAIGQPISEIVE